MQTTDRPPLKIVETLCHALEDAEIRYCHWKSNDALDRSASGENDLDLLVDRADGARFAELLLATGFKPAELPSALRLPGIGDWYGLDPDADRLVHAHVHYQLVLGDDMTKNVHLPVERAYLAGAVQDGLFKLPPSSLELIVFVIRMMLKHASWDAILTGQGRLSSSERRELGFLSQRADPDEVERMLRKYLPFLDPALFRQCRAAVEPGAPRHQRVRTARALQRALAAHSRTPPRVDTVMKVTRRFRYAFVRKVLKRRSHKRLVAGGRLVAIVGGDGSGKSSSVRVVVKRLERDLDVRRFHLGKPSRSLLSHLVRTPIRAARLAGVFSTTRLPADATIDASCPGRAWLVWHALNARDRRRTYLRARRFATEGGVAVCDRYPTAQFALMDGSRVAHLAGLDGLGPIARRLAQYEVRCYDEILPPDLMVVMSVDPELAVARRPEQDEAFVRGRNREVRSVDWGDLPVTIVDASQPLDAVLREVSALVWASL
jgi:thymidylate kinase